MSFNPNLEIGAIISNDELVSIYGCGNMGGMRRSYKTNTLVLVSDYTKGLYHDRWIGGTLHYTGMGKVGDQDIEHAQNKTLAQSAKNGVDCQLFQVIDAGEYIYSGHVELVSKPYIDIQEDENGESRKVWVFPIRPVPENNVRKLDIFVFSSMEDYMRRKSGAEKAYIEYLNKNGRKLVLPKNPGNSGKIKPVIKPVVNGPVEPKVVGTQVKHKDGNIGVIVAYDGTIVRIKFPKNDTKEYNYKMAIDKGTIVVIN